LASPFIDGNIGLGAKLVRENLQPAGTPYVEMVAIMTRYNPFAEKAAMTRVAEPKPEPKLPMAVRPRSPRIQPPPP
jgi:hypothetical protein